MCSSILILVIVLLALLIPITYTLGISHGKVLAGGSPEGLVPNPSILQPPPLTASGCNSCATQDLCQWNGGVRTDVMRVFC
jgi:hypothetical protein